MPDDLATTTGLDAAALAHIREALAARPRGLFSDVDGTLSPIAPTPESAALLPGVADLLDRAQQCFDVVAAVSGRSAHDARRMVGLDTITYIGNHGFEWLEPRAHVATPVSEAAEAHILPEALPYQPAVEAVLTRLGADLAPRFPGLRIEPKGVTASVHVRNTPDPAAAEDAAYRLASELAAPQGLRVTRGKLVVELRPPVAVDKGAAVARVIRERGLRAALYLGDDRTDIDAFRALRRLTNEGACRGVAVAILHNEAPADLAAEADVTLDSIQRVPALLRWLLTAI
ncbi:MAG TPA: trehalose-phosphatase [Ktedonobacterales bacterium]|nr:trehalose-phosphatase [Ktedonobacterales bacterium]